MPLKTFNGSLMAIAIAIHINGWLNAVADAGRLGRWMAGAAGKIVSIENFCIHPFPVNNTTTNDT